MSASLFTQQQQAAAATLAACAVPLVPGVQSMLAPITGRIVHIDVKAGQQVAAQQTLVVLEAMKMEYQVQAPAAAQILAVACTPDQWVDLGTLLVTLQT